LLVYLPFSIYLAWISVATIANTAIFLTYIQWSGWGITPVVWTVIMLSVASVLAITISLLKQDLFFVLVFIWAFIGIGVNNPQVLPINYAVWFFSGGLLTHCIWLFLHSKIAGPTFKNRLL